MTLFEKEDRLASHQTGRNSGVVHAGLYYEPGSNKAVLCRRGVGLLEDFCEQRGIRRIACGKVLVALDDAERARLDDIEKRALANGVPGVRIDRRRRTARAGTARPRYRRAALAVHVDRGLRRGDTGARRRRRRGGAKILLGQRVIGLRASSTEVVVTARSAAVPTRRCSIGSSYAAGCRATDWPSWPETAQTR